MYVFISYLLYRFDFNWDLTLWCNAGTDKYLTEPLHVTQTRNKELQRNAEYIHRKLHLIPYRTSFCGSSEPLSRAGIQLARRGWVVGWNPISLYRTHLVIHRTVEVVPHRTCTLFTEPLMVLQGTLVDGSIQNHTHLHRTMMVLQGTTQ